MYHNKVILTDCDGVLLEWNFHFTEYMTTRGYVDADVTAYNIHDRYGISDEEATRLVKDFNHSAIIGRISPLRDSIKYVRKLYEEHGYIFRVITALTKMPIPQQHRIQNLYNVFGEGPIDEVHFSGFRGDKTELMEPYRDSGCIWIEDKISNYKLGERMGLDPILIDHEYNQSDEKLNRVRNWKGVYDYITGG